MEILAELCSIRNLADMNLSTTIAEDRGMMVTLVGLQSCKDPYPEMAQRNHRQPSKHIARVAPKWDTVVVELLPMSAEEVETLLDV